MSRAFMLEKPSAVLAFHYQPPPRVGARWGMKFNRLHSAPTPIGCRQGAMEQISPDWLDDLKVLPTLHKQQRGETL